MLATLDTKPTQIAESVNYEIGWQPIPNSSQELAISCPCSHILYEGARGPGKTITQLMRFASRVGLGYGKYWKGVIFDREFDNLSGLVTESKKWFPIIFPEAKFLESASAYKWIWPTGEELLFRHVKKPADYDGFHGHEYPFLGWNELTKYPTSDLYDKFMSVNRSTSVLTTVPRGATSIKRRLTQLCPGPFGLVVLNTSNGILGNGLPSAVL
jgi:hypothetical protein